MSKTKEFKTKEALRSSCLSKALADWVGTYSDKEIHRFYEAMDNYAEAYASQLHPSHTPDVDLKDNMFMNGGNTDTEKSFYAMGYRDGQASTPDVTEAVFTRDDMKNAFDAGMSFERNTWRYSVEENDRRYTQQLYSLFKNQKQ